MVSQAGLGCFDESLLNVVDRSGCTCGRASLALTLPLRVEAALVYFGVVRTAGGGIDQLFVLTYILRSRVRDWAMLGPEPTMQCHWPAYVAQCLDPYTASQHCTPAGTAVENCSSLALGRILGASLAEAFAVALGGFLLDRGVAGVVGSHLDHIHSAQTQLEASCLGSPGMKQQRMVPRAEE